MTETKHTARLEGLDRPRGAEARFLRLGDAVIGLEGLDRPLAEALDRRWGGFLGARAEQRPSFDVRVYHGGDSGWLEQWQGPEAYRLEPIGAGRQGVVSYHFAVAREREGTAWRMGLSDTRREPIERAADNAVRFLAASLALDRGGFALHGAGVLRGGRARVLAGPSGAGKSTAVRLAAPAASLGDDFALVLPSAAGWTSAAVPFDNSERADRDPPRGWFAVEGIWRLYQSDRLRIEWPAPTRAVASLLGCAAFPWAMPDRSEHLLRHVSRFVDEGRFGHLFFRHDSDLWSEWIDRRD